MIKRTVIRAFPRLPAIRRGFSQAWKQLQQDSELLGWKLALNLSRNRHIGYSSSQSIRHIQPTGYHFPFYYRPNSSDPQVLKQVLFNLEYACVASVGSIEYIIDCGANIGCTSYYLLHQYPQARIAVLEPDRDNMNLCKRNLKSFGDRVQYFNSGVWDESMPVVVKRGEFRDGQAWSYQIAPIQHGQIPDFYALTMEELLKKSGFPRIDLLKMDIEGAEKTIFASNNFHRWLNVTKNLVIEIHGDDCYKTIYSAMSDYEYDLEHIAELTVFRNINRRNRVLQ